MFTIDLSEVHALAGHMLAHAEQTEPIAEQIVGKVAFDIEAAAKVLVPVDTGNLKNSIAADLNGLEATVTADTEYADYVEFGTSRMAAQPYMGPAFDLRSPDLESALAQLGEQCI
ncbi:HK97-gp10 family putative phage morphogenesis protein [Nocardioides speluncae]|uniref:HK97-gp10 family putative phage morphogenesis protein n=1 Tax=Nocardioides speluncae TaxID=2670337 RepID=UPI00197EF3EE|nr:HK97-gp10 family putative phage morphogenesis protein [Nocardioides speluncae]